VTFGLLSGAGLLCLVASVGATSPSRLPAQPSSLRQTLSQAPAATHSRQNPYDAQADAVLAGGKLFRHHCAECHGPAGGGSEHAPSLRSPLIKETAPGVLFWFLTNGNLKHGMPSWSRLPDERRWQLVSYLKSLATP